VTSGASLAIASAVSRRGWRRRHGTPRTIHATGETGSYQRKNRDTRRAAGVSGAAVAGAAAASLREKSLRCPSSIPPRAARFSSTSAHVGASVPRPHATSPKPAAPAHSARARCRRPAAQCPAPAATRVTTGATADTHPRVPEGLPPSRTGIKARHSRALLSSRAIPSLSPWRRVRAKYAPQAPGPFTCKRPRVAGAEEGAVTGAVTGRSGLCLDALLRAQRASPSAREAMYPSRTCPRRSNDN